MTPDDGFRCALPILHMPSPPAPTRPPCRARRRSTTHPPAPVRAGRISSAATPCARRRGTRSPRCRRKTPPIHLVRSEEHTSELQSLMRISYAVFCLKKKKNSYEHLK